MKQEIPSLMKSHGVDALWVSGAAQHNPYMVYLTGGAHLTQADLFYCPGHITTLCHGPMERDEAAKTRFRRISYADYNFKDLLRQAEGNQAKASALLYKQILESLELSEGKVLLYGMREFGPFFSMLQELQKLLPGLELSGDTNDAILLEARATKDATELERIRKMGEVTVGVVAKTLAFLKSHTVSDETLRRADGVVLTIGDVKQKIDLWLAEAGAENPEDSIFAIGKDAGVPHSSGKPSDPIRLGQTIVFDIFPCEKGGGYFYDFTRTWCLGYASEDVQRQYQTVLDTYNTVVAELKLGENPNAYQMRTCQLFEAAGHETVGTNPRVTQGYVHGLGHGVGLDVHEKPWFSNPDDASNILQPGSVFTIEPGLYYPEKGFGIRLEDTFFVSQEGEFIRFVDFPMDLVIPMDRS